MKVRPPSQEELLGKAKKHLLQLADIGNMRGINRQPIEVVDVTDLNPEHTNAGPFQVFDELRRCLHAHSPICDQNERLLGFPTSGKRKARRLQSLLKRRAAPTGNGTDLSRCHLGKAFTVLEYHADRLLGVPAGCARKHAQCRIDPAYSFKPQNESEARTNRKIAPGHSHTAAHVQKHMNGGIRRLTFHSLFKDSCVRHHKPAQMRRAEPSAAIRDAPPAPGLGLYESPQCQSQRYRVFPGTREALKSNVEFLKKKTERMLRF